MIKSFILKKILLLDLKGNPQYHAAINCKSNDPALTPKIRLLILPSSCYTFPCKQVIRI